MFHQMPSFSSLFDANMNGFLDSGFDFDVESCFLAGFLGGMCRIQTPSLRRVDSAGEA